MNALQNIRKWGVLGITLIIIVLWLFYISKYSLNIPRTADDIRFFLYQFSTDYINTDTFIDRIKYLGKISNWPHTKIVGRIIQIIQYHITGSVNFKVITIAGNLLYLPFIYVLSRLAGSRQYSVGLVLASWLLVPIFNSYWSIFSVSFAGNLCLCILILYAAIYQRWMLFGIVSLLSVFIHGHIAIVPFVGAGLLLTKVYLNDKSRLHNKEILFIISVLVATILLFYFHIIENPVRRDDQGFGIDVGLIQKIISTSSYITTYATQSITSIIVGKQYNSLGLIIGFPILLYTAILTVLTLKRGNRYDNLLLGLLAICIISAFISGWVRNDGLTYMPRVSPRYEAWSILFMALLTTLSLNQWGKKKITLPLIIVFSLSMYSLRMFNEIPSLESIPKQRITYLGDLVGDFKYLSKGDKVISQRIKSSINNGLYSPDLTIQQTPESVKRRKVKQSEDSKIEVVKHSSSATGTILTIAINDNIYSTERLMFYSKINNIYDIYQPVMISNAIGLKQGFDRQLDKPDIPHLQLLTTIIPPGSNEVGVLRKKKDHYVKLKTIIH